jgi:hypothetical protein
VQADLNQLPPYFPLFALIFVVGFFFLTSFLTSVFSGWHALARRFRAESEPYGVTKSAGPFFYTVYTRYASHYSFCIRMTAAEDGFYLSVVFPLRVGHPPLRIPWSEVQISRVKRFWQPLILLTLGARERIPMRISERMAGKLGLLERMGEGTFNEPNFDTLSDSFLESQRKKMD